MKYYHNLYQHDSGQYKGRTDNEYYAVGNDQVLCLYIPLDEEQDLAVELSRYTKEWDFGSPIQQVEFERKIVMSNFHWKMDDRIINFYLSERL